MNTTKLSNLNQFTYKYSITDVMIIEALGKLGPRNIFRIAKYLNIPEPTIRYRINRLRGKGLLKLHTNVYHTNLGLKKSIVFSQYDQELSSYIPMFLSVVDYWVAQRKVRGISNELYSLYISPVEHIDDLKVFLKELKSLGVIIDFQLKHSTCFYNVNPSTSWYDLSREVWIFKWDELEKDIDKMSVELPYTLRDPDSYPLKGDWYDVMILKELEKDATVSFRKLSEILETTPQNIHYHYQNHIMARNLIEDFQVFLMKFPPEISYYIFLFMEFHNYTNLAKMANTIRDKPFTNVIGKIIGEDKLFTVINIPAYEFSAIFDKLDELVEKGYIKRYHYRVSHFMDWWKRQTLSYKNFRDDHWHYPHDEYMDAVYELYNKVRRSRIVV
jgi:DNA-binding Lrp family transcriptional regulator